MKRDWYRACGEAARALSGSVPAAYRSRTFAGIIGDIRALPPKKAASLVGRKKGLGVQYARLYLSEGIDGGRGYQACACEALAAVLGDALPAVVRAPVLDVGCAVGGTAGVLGLEGVAGFDLFPDLLRAARLVDRISGARNRHLAADMTRSWPFRASSFSSVVCGLVCHHLRDGGSVRAFFGSAWDALVPGGSLVVTLPAGSVADAARLGLIADMVEDFGFARDKRFCGMAVSTDDPRSLFWMFLLVFLKKSGARPDIILDRDFGFPELRTPETRGEKGAKARSTGGKKRLVRHRAFRFLPFGELDTASGGRPLVYETVRAIADPPETPPHSTESTALTGL